MIEGLNPAAGKPSKAPVAKMPRVASPSTIRALVPDDIVLSPPLSGSMDPNQGVCLRTFANHLF